MAKLSTPTVILCVALAILSMNVGATAAQPAPTEPGVTVHDPEHATQPTGWCALHVQKRELAHALSDCSLALSRDPNDVQALTSRGSAFLFSKDPTAAIKDLERAISLRPDVASLYLYRGLGHSDLGTSDKAIADFSRAIALRADLVMAWLYRANEYEKLGETKLAAADFEAAFKLAPDIAETFKRLEGQRRSL